MANTRNKNTSLNYKLEQREHVKQDEYSRLYGESYETQMAGNGLIHGKLPREHLSDNPINTESFLFGINSTNLVNPEPVFQPQYKTLSEINLFEKDNVIIPEPFFYETGQRPLYK